MRSRISRGWEQELGTSSLRFVPGPRPSKHSRRAKDQSARKIVEQAVSLLCVHRIMLVNDLSCFVYEYQIECRNR